MIGDRGIAFYNLLVDLSLHPDFAACADYMPQPDKEKKGVEELVLRFFATKNYIDGFQGSVRDWLDEYMEEVLLEKLPFDLQAEAERFKAVMTFARQKLGDTAFLRYRGDAPVGALPPAYFEAITMGINDNLEQLHGKSAAALRAGITNLIQSDPFRLVTGPGANSKEKLRARIRLAGETLLAAV
jgi:hypothetical protein